jgi:hypothetical protein
MKLIITTIVLSIAAALALAASAQAATGSELDPRARAKIAKAKAKAATLEADNFNFLNNGNRKDKPACGSQSIGNVNLNGQQAGVGPREIFIFAPDAINIVGPRGCQ